MLLHGYGSSAEGWEPFTKTIRWPQGGRFVFPQGPETFARSDGAPDGHAWWRLDLLISHCSRTIAAGSFPGQAGWVERRRVAGRGPPRRPATRSRRADRPRRLLARSDGRERGRVPIGRQASRSCAPLRITRGRGVVGTPLRCEARHPRLHGARPRRPDAAVRCAERFRSKLDAAGVKVTWSPFDGGHEIPATVVIALNKFIEGLPLAK